MNVPTALTLLVALVASLLVGLTPSATATSHTQLEVTFLDRYGAEITDGTMYVDDGEGLIESDDAHPYTFDGLPDGDYILTGYDPTTDDFSPATAASITGGVADDPTPVVQFPQVNVTVTFLDESDTEVVNGDLTIEQTDPCCTNTAEVGSSPYELSLADGTYEISGFDRDTGFNSLPEEVVVTEGVAEPSELTIGGPPGPPVDVTVEFLNADGNRVTHGQVTAEHTHVYDHVYAEGDSPYTLSLTDGTWSVYGTDYDTYDGSLVAEVKVADGVATPNPVQIKVPTPNLTVHFQDTAGNRITSHSSVTAISDCCDTVSESGYSPIELHLPDGTWDLTATDGDTGATSDPKTVTITDGAQQEITLVRPDPNVTVTFKDLDGNPVDWSEVRAEQSECCNSRSSTGSSSHEFFLEAGTWEILGYDLNSQRYSDRQAVSITGDETAPVEVVLQLQPANVDVTFRDSGGNPIANGLVTASDPTWMLDDTRGSGESPVGLYLPDGDWELRGTDQNTGLGSDVVAVTVEDGVAKTAPVLTREDPTLVVTFLDAEGNPVADGRVSAEPESGDCCPSSSYGGSPHSLNLADGNWLVTGTDNASGASTQPKLVTVDTTSASPTEVRIQIPPPNVTVTFIDRDGNRITDGWVEAASDTCCDYARATGGSPYELTLLAGTWTLTAYDYETGESAVSQTITVTDGTPVDVAMTLPPLNVTVEFQDAEGRAIQDGYVEATSDCCRSVTKYGGSPYELALQDGTWSIVGTDATGQGRTSAASLVVEDGAPTTNPVVLQLPPVNVTATVLDADGNAVTSEVGVEAVNSAARTIIDAEDAPFEFSLFEGNWDLRAFDNSTGGASEPVTVQVTDDTVTGVVVELHLPRPNLQVTLSDASGSPVLDGRIVAEPTTCCADSVQVSDVSPIEMVLPEGTWEVWGEDFASGTTTDAATVTVNSAGEASPSPLDLQLPAENLQVTLLDAAGDPVLEGRVEATPRSGCCRVTDRGATPYEFGLRAGTWDVRGYSAEDRLWTDHETVTVEAGTAPSPLTLRLPPQNVTVELVDELGTAIEHGRVEIARASEEWWWDSRVGTGPFELQLTQGTYTISGSNTATGGRADSRTITVDESTSGMVVTLTVSDPNLTVEVLAADTTPITGGRLVAERVDTCCDSVRLFGDSPFDVSLGDGTWRLTGYSSNDNGVTDSQEVVVTGGDAVPSSVSLSLPSQNLTVTFKDTQGNPIPNASVRATPTSDIGASAYASGTPFSLALLDGTYEVTGYDPATGGRSEPETVTVDGGTADPATVDLTRPDTNLTVDFVDADGNAVDHAYVRASSTVCCDEVSVDGSGSFRLVLDEGTWDLYGATYDDIPAPEVITVDGDGLASPSHVTFELPPVNVTPTFQTESGDAITDGHVIARLVSGCCSETSNHGAPYDLKLHDGTWELTAYDAAGTASQTEEVTVVDGQPVDAPPDLIRPNATVHVEVVDAANQPITDNLEVWGRRYPCCKGMSMHGEPPFDVVLGDGTWEFGAYQWSSSTTAVTQVVTVSGGAPSQEVITLKMPGTNVDVDYFDADGAPVTSGEISARRVDGDGSVYSYGSQTQYRSGGSPYELQLTDGEWLVEGEQHGVIGTTDPVLVTVTDGAADPARITLNAPAPNVTVDVVDTADQPVTGVTLYADSTECCETHHVNGDPPLELALPDGTWELGGWQHNTTIELLTTTVRVDAGAADPPAVTLVQPDPNLIVHLEDAGGSPVPDGSIEATPQGHCCPSERSSGASPHGLLLADGTWELIGRSGDGSASSEPATVVMENGAPTEGDLTLTLLSNAPQTTIDDGPTGTVGSDVAMFEFSSDSTEATFECNVDGRGWTTCTSPHEVPGLTDGEHTFKVRASDSEGTDTTPASRTWTVDMTAPETMIDSGPDGTTTGPSTTFEFSSSEAGSTFECRRDGAEWAACTSPHELTVLTDGSHTFDVRATDAVDNIDDTPASRTWTVDATAPETEITDGPKGTINSDTATFQFGSLDESATFECKLDEETWATCTSPEERTALAEGEHTFQVRASDTYDNTDATPAIRTWTVDTAPPETTIDAGPDGTTTGPSTTFDFSSNEPGSTFECNLDADGWIPCTSPHELTELSDGAHTIEVRAIDAAGTRDATPASRTWTVDAIAPDTTITNKPSGTAATDTVSFEFTSDDAGATFECSLDAGNWTTCTSPHELTGLADGEHTLDVRATDEVGNTDESPATGTWTVDTTAPETTITSGPDGPTSADAVTFEFSSDEAGIFECRVDGGAWAECESPQELTSLPDGEHTFEVVATDEVGHADATPASRMWTVDTVVPETTIDDGPSGTIITRAATLEFSSDEPEATFECSLDAGDWMACASPREVTGLTDGDHNLEVRAVDPASNTDATPASRTWTVDATAPGADITSGPSGSTTATSATFEFTSADAEASYECRLDGGTWTACTSPVTHTGLAEGTHTFEVRGTDVHGNTDMPASRAWTIDTIAPGTALTSGPSGNVASDSATLRFDSADDSASFQCRLDGGSWGACASPKGYSSLTDGSHTFAVRARDAAGNVDPTPATRSWTVDTTAPDTSITSGPSGTVETASASFGFTSVDSGATFQCRLDDGAWEACSSPKGYSGLTDGTHAFAVRAVDGVGNVDPSPATRSWLVDAVPDTVEDPGFTDDNDSVFEEDIARLAAAGITAGCNPPHNDEFCPDDDVTRGQMAAFIVRARTLQSSPRDYFRDDDGNVFERDINRLAHAGITSGCNPPTNDRYCPGEKVTRGQMAAFLVRALELPKSPRDYFRDDSDSVFQRDINALAHAGITAGCNPPDNDRFCPDDNVTRGQMAAFLTRALDL